MKAMREGTLELAVPPGVRVRKFDGAEHGLSHCMKAVDFVVEDGERIFLIEIKDPDDPGAPGGSGADFLKGLIEGKKDDELVRKYRDSFLYLWAEVVEGKKWTYCVLVAAKELEDALLLWRTEELRRKLPVDGPGGRWRRRFADGCVVCNIAAWNRHLPQFRARRLG